MSIWLHYEDATPEYTLKCALPGDHCYGHTGSIRRSRGQMNTDLLDLGFKAGDTVYLGVKAAHTGNSGAECSAINFDVESRGSTLSWGGHMGNQNPCNAWGQLAEGNARAPDITLCAKRG